MDQENRFTFNIPIPNNLPIIFKPGDGTLSDLLKRLVKNRVYMLIMIGRDFGFDSRSELIVRYTPTYFKPNFFTVLYERSSESDGWIRPQFHEFLIQEHLFAMCDTTVYDVGTIGQKISETVSPDQVTEAENFGVDVALPVAIKKGKTNPYIATKILNYLHGVDDPNNPKNKQVIDNIYRDIWPKPKIPREFLPGHSDPREYLTNKTSWIWNKALGRDQLLEDNTSSSSDIQAKPSFMDRAKGLFGNKGGKKSRKYKKSKKSRKYKKSRKSRK